MLNEIHAGNTITEAQGAKRLWFVGSTENLGGIIHSGLRHSELLQMRWDEFEADAERENWAPLSSRIGVVILVKGKFTLFFTEKLPPIVVHSKTLSSPGDYVIWREDVFHKWKADELSSVICVRWHDAISSKSENPSV